MIPTRVGGFPCGLGGFPYGLGIPAVRVGFPCDAAPTVDWVSDDIELGVVRTIYSAFMLFGMYLCATAACSVLHCSQRLYLRVPLKYIALV